MGELHDNVLETDITFKQRAMLVIQIKEHNNLDVKFKLKIQNYLKMNTLPMVMTVTYTSHNKPTTKNKIITCTSDTGFY